MSATEVYNAIHGVKVGKSSMPVAHFAFKVGSAPKLPWCVYYLDEAEGTGADNRNYAVKNHWVVEHYWIDYDPKVEQAIEQAIEENFGSFSKIETWIESESCAQTLYRFAEFD